LVTGIGQGYVLTTPLQLAAMTAQLVNGGHRVQPNLLRDPSASSAAPRDGTASSLGFSPASLKFMIGALSDVVNAPTGTAHASRITRAKWAMGGKTGTSQVRRITVLERERGVKKNVDRPWKDRDHALFVGFAPVDRPRYAISIVVEHGGAGAKMAAPMARDILTELQRRGLGGGERLVRASAT
jgi:penicillin-binding protein 2